MIWVSTDEQRIVTTNVNAGTVSLIEREKLAMPGPPPGGPGGPPPGGGGPPRQNGDGKDWNEVVVKVGNGSEGFDLSPDEKEIWVGNAQDGTISVIDYPAKKVVATLEADVRGVNRLKFTKDGKYVLVSTLSGADLTVLDAATRKVMKRVSIGMELRESRWSRTGSGRLWPVPGWICRGGRPGHDDGDREDRCRTGAGWDGLGDAALGTASALELSKRRL